jgi:hypothetical protein
LDRPFRKRHTRDSGKAAAVFPPEPLEEEGEGDTEPREPEVEEAVRVEGEEEAAPIEGEEEAAPVEEAEAEKELRRFGSAFQ